jgi:hypothetical protein
MDAVELSAKWTLFMEAEGGELEQKIYEDLHATSHLFDIQDGVHAKWTPDGTLGLLLVFDEDEADSLFDAFRAAIGGVQEAGEAFAYWTASLMGLLRQALAQQWTDGADG